MKDCDENYLVHNGHLELEIFVERPVCEVWTRFIDMAAWVTSHTIESAKGTPGALGSIMRASFKRAAEMGIPLPHYHYCKVIKLIPERQYLFKTYSEEGGSYGISIKGFDDARFHQSENGTRITFNFYGEYVGRYLPKDPSDGDHMMRNLQNLKRITEG